MWPGWGPLLQGYAACRSSSVSVHQRDGRVVFLPGAVSRVGCLEETCSLGEQTRMSEDQQGKVNLHSQTLFLLTGHASAQHLNISAQLRPSRGEVLVLLRSG